MKRIAFTLFALLAACGGGGGGGGTPGGGTPPTITATPTPCPSGYTGSAPNCVAPTTTNASGTDVDDATGAPLAGESVKLMPWGGGPGTCNPTPAPAAITPESDGCPTPLPAPVATTDANGNFTLANAPNGHYVLIIGNDTVMPVPVGYTTPAPGSTTAPTPVPGAPIQATVHDNVTLTGGNQVLKAPTLPAMPAGYTPPAWETNGSYRQATLDATTEMPCYVAWQYQRQTRSLPLGSVDEWLVENVRAGNAYGQTLVSGGIIPTITQQGASSSGGVACVQVPVGTSTFVVNASATDLRALWFGGQFYIYAAGTQSIGRAEFPIDPRSFTDPVVPVWP